MKLSSHKSDRDSKLELSMTSMIDVVFLLLIFFVMTASLVKTERELKSAIKTSKQAPSQTSDFEPAIIDIVPSGGGFAFKIGSNEIAPTKPEKDTQELTKILRAFPSSAKGYGAFVRVSDEAPFQMAATAIQSAKAAGFVDVTYVPHNQ